jgi:hypothetical protein
MSVTAAFTTRGRFDFMRQTSSDEHWNLLKRKPDLIETYHYQKTSLPPTVYNEKNMESTSNNGNCLSRKGENKSLTDKTAQLFSRRVISSGIQRR